MQHSATSTSSVVTLTLMLQKNTRFHHKKTLESRFAKKPLDQKSKLTHRVKMPKKCVAMPTIETLHLCNSFVNQRQRNQKIAATLVFVCTGHWNFTDDQV